MLFRTSYYSKETEIAINNLAGKPFGIWRRIQLGGVGSQRFIVDQADTELSALFSQQNTPVYTNIELRPTGIILWFRVKLDNWALVLPYHQLSIFRNANDVTLHAAKWRLRLLLANNLSLNMSFFQKLLRLKDVAMQRI